MIRRFRDVVALVARAYELPPSVVITRTTLRAVEARAAVVLILHQVDGWAYAEIGRHLSRHHTSVIEAERRAVMDEKAVRLARAELAAAMGDVRG